MRRLVLVMLVLAIGSTLFVSLKPSTPARTFDAYELKAKDTAESALSSVETARLAARVATDGKAFGPYVSVMLSETETAVGEVQTTFSGYQPPDARADHVRSKLDRLLNDAADHLADLRIAARRGQLHRLDRLAAPLASVAGQLRRFLAVHG